MKSAFFALGMLSLAVVRPAAGQGVVPRIVVDGGPGTTSPSIAASASLQSSCRGLASLSYLVSASSQVGDTVRVEIKLGAGPIGGGTSLHINRVKFNLDCRNTSLGLDCTDDGNVVSYQGNLTTTCGVPFTTTHQPDDLLPNQVVFDYGSGSLDIPAGIESFCSLSFDVRIEGPGSDGTPDLIEQVTGYSASTNDGVCNTTPPIAAGRTTTGQICVGTGCETTHTSCELLTDATYPGSQRLLHVGSTLRAHISLAGGATTHSAPISVHRLKFNLDCQNSSLGLDCADDGSVISYQGNLTTTCGVPWTTTHAPGDLVPNQVVFEPAASMMIPANAPDYCSIDFDVRIEGRSNDGTPDVIEQVFGMNASTHDAECDILGQPRPGGETGSSSFLLCPVCNDGNQCNGLEYCDGEQGCAPGTPIVCDDHNVCTDDACDPDVYEPGDPCVFTDNGARCNDDDACTDSTCDPGLGCVIADNSARCDDGSPCTSDACDPASGECLHVSLCDDGNACTSDACDTVSGCRHDPISCDDGNSCTDDACDPAAGCAHAGNGSCGANPRGLGYWKRLCRGPHPSGDFYTSADLDCARGSCAFPAIGSIADLCGRLSPNPPNDACAKAEAHFLVLKLNVCRGRVSESETIHSDCGDATTVGEAIAAIEERLCDSARTADACRDAACAAEEIDSGHALGVTSLRVRAAGAGIELAWGPPYLSDDGAAALRYRIWRRPSSEAAFVQIGETHDLAFTEAVAPAAGAQYEVTVVW